MGCLTNITVIRFLQLSCPALAKSPWASWGLLSHHKQTPFADWTTAEAPLHFIYS